MIRLSPFVRRSGALSILVGACLALWSFVVNPIGALFAEYNDSIDNSHQLLSRYSELARQRPIFEAALDDLVENEHYRDLVLAGSSVDLMGATLQKQMAEVISRHGGQVRSTQLLADEVEGNFQKIRIRVNMTGDMDSLFNVLHAIESARPLLFLDNVYIKGSQISGTFAKKRKVLAGLTPAPENGRLQVAFDVLAYGGVRGS
jgi:general secretion pathway protein M